MRGRIFFTFHVFARPDPGPVLPTRPLTRVRLPRSSQREPVSSSRLPAPARSGANAPRWGAQSAFALLATVLCLVAQVGGAAHLALVSHVRCFEHDALVHAEAGQVHDRAAGREQPVAETTAGLAASGVPAETAVHADDHCAVVALRRREHGLQALPATPLSSPPPTASVAVPPVRQDEVLVGPVARLRFAPKASPPAVLTGRC